MGIVHQGIALGGGGDLTSPHGGLPPGAPHVEFKAPPENEGLGGRAKMERRRLLPAGVNMTFGRSFPRN